MKVGVTMVMIGGVVGEVITAQRDLGYIILFAASTGETATVLAAIVLLCGIGLVLFGLIVLAEQGTRRWYGERAAGRECDMTVLFAVLPTASLPMYNLPEMRPLNARFWQALRELLAEAGLRDVPEALSFDRPPVPERIGPEILFSQTCGYPLETIFRGQAIRLGTPCYRAPGCDGPTHRGVFVVPAASPARELGDLRGGVFLFNHRHSNSGMNLPRRSLADIADRRPLFAQAIETGSQPGNLDRIAGGEADATAVDCVTYAFWRRHRPEAARQVRILGWTPPSPAIPFVTSSATPAPTIDILRRTLRRLVREARCREAAEGLMLADIVDVPDGAYRGLLDYERDAAALGYPDLT